MPVKPSKIEEPIDKKQTPWRNPSFCFRFSVLTIFIWLMISSIFSIMIYFLQLHDSKDNFGASILAFSTWLFILPGIASFGLINAMPLIIPWLMKPVEENSDKNIASPVKTKNSPFSKSYKSMTDKLEKPENDQHE